MASTDNKVRYVTCPKCFKLLKEITDVPVYQCGGCNALLLAKHYNAARENGTLGSLEIIQSKNLPGNGSSDNGTASGKQTSPSSNAHSSEAAHVGDHSMLSNLGSSFSSAECNRYHRGESSETGENGIKEDSNTNELVCRSDPECTSKSQPEESIQIRTEYCLNEEAGKSLKLRQRVSDSLMLSNKLEESPESTVTGENEIKEEGSNTDKPAFRNDAEYTSINQPDESIQTAPQYCLNEEVEKYLKQSQQVSLGDKLEESPESVIHDVASEEDLVGRAHGDWHGQYLRSSSQAYDGSVSSSDIRSNDCFHDNYLLSSARSFSHQRVLSSVHSKEREGGDTLENNKMDTYLLPKLQDLSLGSSNERNMGSFGSNRDESSSRYHVHSHERGSSLDSADFHSVQDWMESEGPTRTVSRVSTFHGDSLNCENGSTSTKFKHLEEDRMELLRTVDELRHQLSELYDQREGRSRSQIRRTPHQHPLFFNHKSGQQFSKCLNPNLIRRPPGTYYRTRTSLPQQYQFSQMPLSGYSCLHRPLEDHHLQFVPNFCHNDPYRACAYNMCSHPSKDVNSYLHMGSNIPPCCLKAQTHDIELEKLHHKEKKQTSKRHCRPFSGGAPFVICYKCSELLQLPADFLILRRRLQKLQCGACSEVLLLSFHSSSRSTPQTPIKVFNPPSEVGSNTDAPTEQEISSSHPNNCPQGDPVSFSEEYGLSFSQSYSTEAEPVLNVSANSSEGRRTPSSTLHRLMGYFSATELLYQPSDDEGYEIEESARPNSYRPSVESHVSADREEGK